MKEELNKAKCEQALKDFTGAVMRSPAAMKFDGLKRKQMLKSRYQRQHDLLKQLIDEHFDNPPLKFEELQTEQWVWDNKEMMYLKSCNNFESKEHGKGIRIQIGFDLVRFKFEENRFYRKQVEE